MSQLSLGGSADKVWLTLYFGNKNCTMCESIISHASCTCTGLVHAMCNTGWVNFDGASQMYCTTPLQDQTKREICEIYTDYACAYCINLKLREYFVLK